jgi:hypothetical protein
MNQRTETKTTTTTVAAPARRQFVEHLSCAITGESKIRKGMERGVQGGEDGVDYWKSVIVVEESYSGFPPASEAGGGRVTLSTGVARVDVGSLFRC